MKENIPNALWESAKKRLDKTALIYGIPKCARRITFREVFKEVMDYALLFKLEGVKPGDRIALMMTNTPQFVFSYYGTLLAGGVVVPINLLSLPRSYNHISEIETPEEIKEQIKDSQPKIIVAYDFFCPILAQIKDELDKIGTKIILTSPKDYLPGLIRPLYPIKAKKGPNWIKKRDILSDALSLKKMLKRQRRLVNPIWDRLPGTKSRPGDVAQLQYTGGTTGIPKGAMLTHRNLLSNPEQCREYMGKYVKDDYTSMLGILPFFHVFGMTVSMNIPLLSIGAPLILIPDSKDIKAGVDWIKKEQVKGAALVSRHFQAISKRPDLATKENLKSVELFISGAGALPESIRKEFEELSGGTIFEGYGLTEASPVVSVNKPGDRKEGSAGKPVPGTEIEIVDVDTDKEIPAGTKKDSDYETGEILVSGPQVMKGYWNKPEETAGVLKKRKGKIWLYTGDIGYLDKDGFLFITDRKKDMVKILGENVYPVKIEIILTAHPYIEEITVVGIADDTPLVALIVLSEDGKKNQKIAAKEISDFAGQKLPQHEVPRRIIIVSGLDDYKNNLGKVQKKKIREDIKIGSFKGANLFFQIFLDKF